MAELLPFVAHTRQGPPLAAPLVFDPQRAADAPFLKRLLALDQAFFGPRGQAMPSWVLYDCALAPGVVAGLAARADELPEAWRAGAVGDELAPVAMVALLPLPRTDRQLVHTLAWYGDEAHGRRALKLACEATRALRVVAGWSSPELRLFAELGPLRLRTAWTTGHDVPATVTADLDLDAQSPSGPFAPLDLSEPALQALQTEVETSARCVVVHTADGFALHREASP